MRAPGRGQMKPPLGDPFCVEPLGDVPQYGPFGGLSARALADQSQAMASLWRLIWQFAHQ